MTDRELLEAAAKAADMTVLWDHYAGDGESGAMVTAAGNVWAPLTDDGDALRLAVKLDLQVRQVRLAAHAGWPDQFWQTVSHDDDKDAATRRAIVRAAAAIGAQPAVAQDDITKLMGAYIDGIAPPKG